MKHPCLYGRWLCCCMILGTPHIRSAHIPLTFPDTFNSGILSDFFPQILIKRMILFCLASRTWTSFIEWWAISWFRLTSVLCVAELLGRGECHRWRLVGETAPGCAPRTLESHHGFDLGTQRKRPWPCLPWCWQSDPRFWGDVLVDGCRHLLWHWTLGKLLPFPSAPF